MRLQGTYVQNLKNNHAFLLLDTLILISVFSMCISFLSPLLSYLAKQTQELVQFQSSLIDAKYAAKRLCLGSTYKGSLAFERLSKKTIRIGLNSKKSITFNCEELLSTQP